MPNFSTPRTAARITGSDPLTLFGSTVACAAIIPAAAGLWATGRMGTVALAVTVCVSAIVGTITAVVHLSRLTTRRLEADRWIATGTGDAPSDEVIEARIGELLDPECRHMTARTLRRIVADADPETIVVNRPTWPNRRQLRRHADDLAALASELDATERPVTPRGAALVQLLVTDGSGPLYNPTRGEDLPTMLRRARHTLAA